MSELFMVMGVATDATGVAFAKPKAAVVKIAATPKVKSVGLCIRQSPWLLRQHNYPRIKPSKKRRSSTRKKAAVEEETKRLRLCERRWSKQGVELTNGKRPG